MAASLSKKHCAACEAKTPPVGRADRRRLHAEIPEWTLGKTTLERTWVLKDFEQAFDLAGRIAVLAEREQHHPDIHLEDYKRLRVVLSTHAIGDLSTNDFILAWQIDDAAKDMDVAEAKVAQRPPRRKPASRANNKRQAAIA